MVRPRLSGSEISRSRDVSAAFGVRFPAMRRLSLSMAIVLTIDRAAADAQLRAQTVAANLPQLVAAVADRLQPGVLYAVLQSGVIHTVQGSTVLPAPFLDLRPLTAADGERELVGTAFAPVAASGRFFVNITNANGDTVVARFRRSSSNPLVADPSSRFDLRWPNGSRVISQPFANHNGGNLVFGPDGYLYIGLGDGGSGNDPNNNAQNPQSLLGKMLRIDVNVPDGDAAGYRVPPDNPFVRGVPIAALGEIWAFGLRNPWRYSFDNPALGGTGALFIGDVGQNNREEIDVAPAGRGGQNYGWRIREGTIATPGAPPTTPAFTPLTEPLGDYGRSTGTTVIGGYVYRGRALGGDFFGRYFFAGGRLLARCSQRGADRAPLVSAHVLDDGPARHLLRPRARVERLRHERAVERGRRRGTVAGTTKARDPKTHEDQSGQIVLRETSCFRDFVVSAALDPDQFVDRSFGQPASIGFFGSAVISSTAQW